MEYSTNGKIHREPYRPTRSRGVTRRDKVRAAGTVSWNEIPPEELHHFVCRIEACGAICGFARSQDGGVLVVTVVCGGEEWKIWPRSVAECLDGLHALLEEVG
jgi:hypothetical protein